MIGIVVGMAFVDARASMEAELRPGAGLTREHLRLPPGLRRKSDLDEPPLAPPEGPTDSAAGAVVDAPLAQAESTLENPTGDTQPQPPKLFADLGLADRIELATPVDAAEMTLGAWIFVDGSRPLPTIRMIASNRQSGCSVDASHAGYAFYVNNWDTSDAALVLEWQFSAGGGCGRLSSEPHTIPSNTWVHVAFAFRQARDGAQGEALLFLNGELLRKGPAVRGLQDISTAGSLTLGVAPDGQFPFSGE